MCCLVLRSNFALLLTIQFALLISSLINIISLLLTTFDWTKVRGIAPRSHTGRPRTCLVRETVLSYLSFLSQSGSLGTNLHSFPAPSHVPDLASSIQGVTGGDSVPEPHIIGGPTRSSGVGAGAVTSSAASAPTVLPNVSVPLYPQHRVSQVMPVVNEAVTQPLGYSPFPLASLGSDHSRFAVTVTASASLSPTSLIFPLPGSLSSSLPPASSSSSLPLSSSFFFGCSSSLSFSSSFFFFSSWFFSSFLFSWVPLFFLFCLFRPFSFSFFAWFSFLCPSFSRCLVCPFFFFFVCASFFSSSLFCSFSLVGPSSSWLSSSFSSSFLSLRYCFVS